MWEAIKNSLRVGGLVYRITDAIDDFNERRKLRRKVKAEQDAAIDRARAARNRVPDNKRG